MRCRAWSRCSATDVARRARRYAAAVIRRPFQPRPDRRPRQFDRTILSGAPWRNAVLGRLATRRHLAWAALLVLALMAGLLGFRRPLSDWLWPDTRIQQLREDAALALAQGRLTSPDGRGARELYEAALALDPDRVDIHSDLARVGQAALEQARRALAEQRYRDAHHALALARELETPRAAVSAVAEALRKREAALAGIDRMLRAAAEARSNGRLEGGDDSALALYQRVLALEPGNVEALEGREDTLADLLGQARRALGEGRVREAAATLTRVQAADPGHVELPSALAALTARLDAHRRSGDRELRRGRLERALREYDTVVAIRPEDTDAVRGRLSVAHAFARRGELLAADFRFGPARAALERARTIAPDAPAVAAAQVRLERAQAARARLNAGALSAGERRQLEMLLREAQGAEAKGDLITPPGESAFDRLRAARAIAPQDPRVQRAIARLLPAARACFEAELRSNRLGRARHCLDAWQALGGERDAAEGRRRLAQRWLAVGNERLGAGEFDAAQAALASARELDSTAGGLDEFAQRLQTAMAGAR
ncbi:hypothetical protein ACFFGH_04695 [Lysobacter korlensis]|uniref:Tetratricopeptide repeat protein n=1 Tax=Lysobacter korlensis TaxID=553636 RepID=A0ABV6RME9_9GAMM